MPPRSRPRSGFRGDLEGLRALAVVLVVLYHSGLPVVPGGFVGVDVFFVLSGFLITGLLVAELRRTGTVSLAGFYARRARRLLPLSALVLVTTAAVSVFRIAPVDHGTVFGDVRAAALYVANWHFALSQSQYGAPTDQSPLVHYWSLAVEEQFYLVWPLLLILLAGRSGLTTRGWPAVRRRIVLALALLGGGSLLLSATLTQGGGAGTYYGTHTRAWELAVGGGLALARTPLRELPRPVATVAGWCGLAMVLGSAVLMDENTPFPGTAAGWPVAGAALIIAAGVRRGTPTGAGRLLDRPVPRYLGRISYSWYLWHWPCLVLLAGVGRGVADPNEPGRIVPPAHSAVLLAVVVSFGLAAASSRLVEGPVRRSAWLATLPRRSLAFGAALTALPVLAGAVLLAAGTGAGTSVIVDGQRVALRQTLTDARTDGPDGDDLCYLGYVDARVNPCTFGDPNGSKVLVVLGDSHADQWLPPLDRIARQRHWKLHLWAKSRCAFIDIPLYKSAAGAPYGPCDTFRKGVKAQLASLPRIDGVLLASTRDYTETLLRPDGSPIPPDQSRQAWQAGLSRTYAQLLQRAALVVQFVDTPAPDQDAVTCASKAGADVSPCDFRYRPDELAKQPMSSAERAAVAANPRVRLLDMGDAVCPSDRCPVISPTGFLKFRDSQHITQSFALTLAPELDRRLQRILHETGQKW